MKNLFKSKKGFTLVEIVIVIAIIGLLMIILIPSAINAFKSNQLQGAKIKAQRVAQQIEAGIGSGKLPLTDANRKDMGITDNASKHLLCSGSAGSTNIQEFNNIYGLENIYNLPSENDELVDPLGNGSAETGNYFRYYWEKAAAWTENAPVVRIYIVNSTNAATETAAAGGENNGLVLYANSADDLRNPVYKKS